MSNPGVTARLSTVARPEGRTHVGEQFARYPLKWSRGTGLGDAHVTMYLSNAAGGLLGGDKVRTEIECTAATHLEVTTPGASSCMGGGGDASEEVRLDVGDGAILEWLPEPTILYKEARLRRSAVVTLENEAAVILCESFVDGRIHHGERACFTSLRSALEVRTSDRPALEDIIHLQPQKHRLQARGANGKWACFGSALIVARRSHDWERLASALSARATSYVIGAGVAPNECGVLARFGAQGYGAALHAMTTIWTVSRHALELGPPSRRRLQCWSLKGY